MKEFLLYLWQLPQNLLGVLVVWLTNGEPAINHFLDLEYYATHCNIGVSLGKYIIIKNGSVFDDLKHEHGHQIQSLRWGWLYLIVIGLPSFLFCSWDYLFHRNWSEENRIRWYYNLPWEKQADILGNVNRW